MEIFLNNTRPNYEEITSYGPKWLTEFREMDANYRYAGWTLDLAAFFMERIINNLFPEYADEQTIFMLEKILLIEYDTPYIDMEERRRTVATYFYGIGKLNRTSIISMAEQYTGCKCADVYWKKYVLYIAVEGDLDQAISWDYNYNKLAKILKRRMPAHLGIGFESRFKPVVIKNRENLFLKNITICKFKVDENERCDLKPKLETKMEIDNTNIERIECTVKRKSKDCWYLDGNYSLDGTRKLDALDMTEVL